MSIEALDISKSYGAFRALEGVSLSVPTGGLVALLGPSGSGKTTLLRIIAGLERPDHGSGRLLFDGQDLTGRDIAERNVGFVFQAYALFRNMTVRENIGFGLSVRPRRSRPSRRAIDDRVAKLLALVQLEGLEARYPWQLSGGQRQRVALARALAIEPRVLLLDEPFGALDAKVRQGLRRWLRRFHDELHVTSVFVTHDQEEALEVADRVVVMNHGRIEQAGGAADLYERPATPFVFDFLGDANILPAQVRGRSVFFAGAAQPVSTDSIHPAGPVDVYVRPGDLRLADPDTPGVEVRILSVQRTGPFLKAQVRMMADDAVQFQATWPHLHHDVPSVVAGAVVRLRLMVFSVYPCDQRLPVRAAVEDPVLIGRERKRARAD